MAVALFDNSKEFADVIWNVLHIALKYTECSSCALLCFKSFSWLWVLYLFSEVHVATLQNRILLCETRNP